MIELKCIFIHCKDISFINTMSKQLRVLTFVFNSISNINRVHVKSLRKVSILSRRVIVLLAHITVLKTHFCLVFIYRQYTTELTRLGFTTFSAADFCRSYMFKNNAQTEGLRLTTVSHTVERRI